MPLPSWPELLLFMTLVLTICLFCVVAAGHFPIGHRSEAFKSSVGTTLLWSTIFLMVVAAGFAVAFAFVAIPWYAAVIGAGLMALLAPLLAQPLSDAFVNGRTILVLLTVATGLVAGSAFKFIN